MPAPKQREVPLRRGAISCWSVESLLLIPVPHRLLGRVVLGHRESSSIAWRRPKMTLKTSNAVASALLFVLSATFFTGCEKKKTEGVTRAQPRRNQGNRRRGLHLRSADRDELRGHVRVFRGSRPDPSTKHRSTRSITKPVSLPTRTRRSLLPTATHPIRYCGWICGLNPSFYRFLQSRRSRYYSVHALTTAIPSTMDTSAPGPPELSRAITWSSDPIGREKRLPASRRCSIRVRSFQPLLIALSSSTRRTCLT